MAGCTEAHAATIRGWLDGTDVPAGLEVDADLRWLLVGQLAALGGLDVEGIEDELARDATITGQEKAAYARAARPDPAAKEAAWDLAVHREDTPNMTQYQVILGFNQRRQDEVLAPYVDRYFDEIDGVWARMNHEVAQNVVEGLYPHHLVVQETLDRTDAWLDANERAPALRRLVTESRDGIARALRCQARDAQLDA